MREQVEEILRERGAGRVRPIDVDGNDGYSVEGLTVDEAQVRCGVGAIADASWIVTPCLRVCTEILIESGFLVKQQIDDRGLYLNVTSSERPA
jgi:hypothetical protein